MRRYRVSTLFFLSCFAAGPKAYTLLEAIEAARQHDPQLAAAAADRSASAEQQIQGRAQLLPYVSLDSRYGVNAGGGRSFVPGSLGSENSGLSNTLGLRQPLFDLPRIARYQRWQATSEEGVVAFTITQQKLLFETASAYFGILVARQNLETAETSMALLSKQLARVREEASLGLSDMVDIDEAVAARDEALAERLSATHMLRDRQRDFTRLTGLDGTKVAGRFVAIPSNHEELMGDSTGTAITLDDIPTLQQSALEAKIAETRVSELRG